MTRAIRLLLLVLFGVPTFASSTNPAVPTAAIECPPGALAEGEPDCYEGYVDTFNPGCTAQPRVYSLLPCDPDTLRVCGRYGKIEYWDLDWYRLTLHAWTTLDVCVQGEGRAQLVIINPTCDNPEIMHCNMVPEVNGRVCCSNLLPPADYLIFIRPYHVDSNVPCGSKYLLEIHGNQCPIDIAPAGWTQVKRLFRD